MSWIDKNFYIDTYCGIDMTTEEFNRYSERACDIINALTSGNAEALCETEAVKRAASAETEILYMQGEGSYTGIPDGTVASENVGNASIGYRKNESLYINGVPVSTIAYRILMLAGLLYKGI